MSLQLFLFDRLFRVLFKRRFAKKPDILQLRKMMQSFARRTPPMPPGIRLEATLLNGVKVERTQRLFANDDTRAVLYVHGGGFVAGAPVNHRPLTRRLAAGLGCPVYSVDYRLAPEHPFPAALDDCLAVYRALLAKGIAPKKIAFGGDSAGGNLVLALSLKLKQLGLEQPGAIVALSPPTDLTEPFPSRTGNAKSDAMFDSRMFPSVGAHYCPGHDLTEPLLSPLRGDHAGMPPTLLMASQLEMLRDDSIRLAEKLREAGVSVQLEVWPKVFHAWPVLADYVPESRAAVKLIVEFIRARL
jgi:monoterpene epsilon-lactone hydrolase